MGQVCCKNCGVSRYVKNGFVRGHQRYKCKDCGCNFTPTPPRGAGETKKALAVLLYSKGKSSYRWIGELLDVSWVTVYRWLRAFAESLPEPEVRADVREMELDEMWHFVQEKKTKFGSGKLTIVLRDDVLPGLSVIVIRTPSRRYGTR
jgi:transposase-like protein